MGNETSTPTVSTTNNTAAKAVEADATITSLATQPKRRIVKAVKPAAPTLAANDEKEEKQDDETARLENEQEETRENASATTTAMRTTQPKTQAKRQAKLQQHRLTPKNNNNANATTSGDSTTASSSTTTDTTTTPPAPHPMSRFLTAFSVETKHPEHKRKQQQAQSEEAQAPAEKRLRGESVDETSKQNTAVFSTTTTVIGMLCVVGVAAMVAWRLQKR